MTEQEQPMTPEEIAWLDRVTRTLLCRFHFHIINSRSMQLGALAREHYYAGHTPEQAAHEIGQLLLEEQITKN